MDGSAALWDTTTGQVRKLGQHIGKVQAIAFSPDGDMVASGDTNGHVKLWNTCDGNLVRELEGHTGEGAVTQGVCALAFSRDHKTLVSGGEGGEGGEVRLWNLDSHRAKSLEGHDGSMMSMAFSPDRRFLVVARGFEGLEETTIWDAGGLAVPKRVAALDEEHPNPMALAFSSDSILLAISGQTDKVFIYHTRTWQKVKELRVSGLLTSGLVFSPDDKTLLTASPCGEVKFWQVGSWQEVGML